MGYCIARRRPSGGSSCEHRNDCLARLVSTRLETRLQDDAKGEPEDEELEQVKVVLLWL